MGDVDLSRIEALATAATPRVSFEWHAVVRDVSNEDGDLWSAALLGVAELDRAEAFAEYIHHVSPDVALALVAEVRMLRRVEEAARNFAAAHWDEGYWRALVDALHALRGEP